MPHSPLNESSDIQLRYYLKILSSQFYLMQEKGTMLLASFVEHKILTKRDGNEGSVCLEAF